MKILFLLFVLLNISCKTKTTQQISKIKKKINIIKTFNLWKKQAIIGKQNMQIIENGKITGTGSIKWDLKTNETWELEYNGKIYNIKNSKLYKGFLRLPATGFIKLLTFPILEWENHLNNLCETTKGKINIIQGTFEDKCFIMHYYENPFQLIYFRIGETELKFEDQ